MMKLADNFRIVALALWLGAAVCFSFVVAPAQFSILRSFKLDNANEIAGTVVTRVLSVVNVSGFMLGLLLVITVFALRSPASKMVRALETGLFGVIALATGIGWLIAARMRSIRASFAVPIDQISPLDPRRLAFDNLHGYSVTALGTAMLAAIIAIILIATRSPR